MEEYQEMLRRYWFKERNLKTTTASGYGGATFYFEWIGETARSDWAGFSSQCLQEAMESLKDVIASRAREIACRKVEQAKQEAAQEAKDFLAVAAIPG